MKFDDETLIEIIRQTESPLDVAKIGRETAHPLKPSWEEIKVEIMKKGLLAKFSQNPDICKILMSTGDEDIVEKTNVDHFWGCGSRGDGLNMLGKLLVEVRGILRSG